MNAARVTQRSTADQTSTAMGANTAKTVNLSSPWTPTVDTAVYVGVMVTVVNHADAGRSRRALKRRSRQPACRPLLRYIEHGQTTAPADGTTMTAVTAGVDVPYCHLS
jgi:hypothetical protein